MRDTPILGLSRDVLYWKTKMKLLIFSFDSKSDLAAQRNLLYFLHFRVLMIDID